MLLLCNKFEYFVEDIYQLKYCIRRCLLQGQKIVHPEYETSYPG